MYRRIKETILFTMAGKAFSDDNYVASGNRCNYCVEGSVLVVIFIQAYFYDKIDFVFMRKV